ncbi:hypothetical protein [Canibacter zhuwentaonis]|uniref:hypothetical protein n=1 Tax=Canibacter zhuwentaonis TaxID=2837491 RepID=UPI001BDD02A8|nr:hypothetical protein [Canibacter zhuwentaonis]
MKHGVLAGASVNSSVRLVVPDFARGLALLGIALANLPTGWLIERVSDPNFILPARRWWHR